MTSTVEAADAADAGHEVPRRPAGPHGRWHWRLQPSSVTLKLIMAGTGIVFALFVFVHMIGNLKVYTGAQHFDAYAHWLRTLLEPLLPYEGALWIFRVVLLSCLIAHVGAAVLLTGELGVGKSTVAANLAVALAKMGAGVGLLDGVIGPAAGSGAAVCVVCVHSPRAPCWSADWCCCCSSPSTSSI